MQSCSKAGKRSEKGVFSAENRGKCAFFAAFGVDDKIFETVKKKYLTPSSISCMITKVIAMEKILEQTLLYDFYGELLTEHQRQVYEDVVLNDFSLSEVAAARGISRQGVHDLVRRCNKTLEEYEEKLHLVQRFVQIRENVNEIRKLTDPSGDTPKEDVMQRIAAIASDILEEL